MNSWKGLLSKQIVFAVLTLLIVYSCSKEDPDVNKVLTSKNGFPEKAENLSLVNSEYDDYNSNLPEGEYDFLALTFSSNRNSKGQQFDLVQKSLDVSYVLESKLLTIDLVSSYSDYYLTIESMLGSINSQADELGPYFYSCNLSSGQSGISSMLFYTQQQGSHSRIRYSTEECTSISNYSCSKSYKGPYEVSLLNSEGYNIGYLCIQNNNLYFQCDRDGSYDIYELPIDTTMSLSEFLSLKINLVDQARKIVSTDADDKCPFVTNDFMIFTSNRQGGYGGFDLWYSRLVDKSWTEPVNLGEAVNTEHDEYRPVIRRYNLIPNDLLIFSSNREGGMGGFDLYYMGITATK